MFASINVDAALQCISICRWSMFVHRTPYSKILFVVFRAFRFTFTAIVSTKYMNALIIEFVDFQFVLLSCQNYNCDVLHTDTATTTCIVHMNSSITNGMRQNRANKKHPQRRRWLRRWDDVDGDDKIVATISHIFSISQHHFRLLHTQERGYSCDWVYCDNADRSNEKKKRREDNEIIWGFCRNDVFGKLHTWSISRFTHTHTTWHETHSTAHIWKLPAIKIILSHIR